MTDKSFDDKAEYISLQFDTLELAMGAQEIYGSIGNTIGFDFVKDFKEDIQDTVNKGVSLGGIGRITRNMAESNFYFTLPFEQLTRAQVDLLVDSGIELEGSTDSLNELEIRRAGEYETTGVFTNSYDEPSNHIYGIDDLGSTIPTLEEIAEKAKGKNATQQTRKSLAGDIGDYVRDIRGDFLSDLIAEKYIEGETQKMRDDMHKVHKHLPSEKNRILDKEAKFRQGLEATENMRNEVDKLKPGLKKDLMQLALDARDRLTELVGRDKVDVSEVRRCIATIVTGTMFEPKFAKMSDNVPSNQKAMETYTSKMDSLIKSVEFNTLTEGFTSDKINDFLTPNGEKKFTNGLLQAIKESKVKAQIKENVVRGKVKDDIDIGKRRNEKSDVVKGYGGSNII